MKKLMALLLLMLPLTLLSACEQEGPIEQAGEEVDQAAEDAGDAIEEGTER